MPASAKRWNVVLRTGDKVVLRPLTTEDKPLIAASFERLSEQSRYRRFFLRLQELPPALLDDLVDVDHHDREAIIATDPAGLEALGVARYSRVPSDAQLAEIAVTVVDDWHGRGLGRALLNRLTYRARQEGIRKFSAEVLGENPEALRLFGTLGDTQHEFGQGVIELSVELPPKRGAGARLTRALRAAATGVLVPAKTLAEVVSLEVGPVLGQPVRPNDRIRTIVVLAAETGSDALAAAMRLGAVFQAKVHVVSERSNADAQRLVGRQRRASSVEGVEIELHRRDRDSVQALVDVALEQHADLLVVSGEPKGTPLSRRSVANRVSHHAPCSVLIVRSRPDSSS